MLVPEPRFHSDLIRLGEHPVIQQDLGESAVEKATIERWQTGVVRPITGSNGQFVDLANPFGAVPTPLLTTVDSETHRLAAGLAADRDNVETFKG